MSSRCKSSLPDLPCPLIGRDKECDYIFNNLSSNQFCFGVIYGLPGVGKTSIAVKVGHSLVSKRWSVSYHGCSDGETTKSLLTPCTKLYEIHNSASTFNDDNINDTFPAQGSRPTLLILDQVENVVKDESVMIPQALQSLLDVAKEVSSFRILFVSRKRVNLIYNTGFSLEVGSLCLTSAVELLQSFFQNSSKHHLELVAKGCGCNPLALTIIRVMISKGIPETEIIGKMSSPKQFWKSQLHSAENCQFLTEAFAKERKRDPLELSDSGNSKTSSQEEVSHFLVVKETNILSEAKVSCNEKAYDHDCQCRLCMNSYELDSLKTVLKDEDIIKETLLKETFEAGEAECREEDCSEVLQATVLEDFEDPVQKSRHFEPDDRKFKFIKSKNQSVGWLGLFLKTLEFLRRLNLLKRLFYDMKEKMKKAKKNVSTSCVNKKLATKLSVEVDEKEHPDASSLTGKKYPVESAEGEKKEKPDIESGICHSGSLTIVNVETPAAQPALDELTKTREAKNCTRTTFLLVLSLLVITTLVGLIALSIFLTKQTSEDNVVPHRSLRSTEMVYSSIPAVTATTLNITSTIERNFSRPICKMEASSNCLRSCSKDQIEVINRATVENVCWPCLSCPPGQEPSVPCGSIVNMGALIQCQVCTTGTFSTLYNSSSCRKCSQCKLNESVVRSCRPSANAVCARCKSNQNTWIDTKKEEYGCFDCPVCLSGFEPSHPCGSVVPYGEIVTCVPCQEGKTFSTMRDKRQCKKCSSCPRGQRIIARCAKYFDTICGGACGHDKIMLLERTNNPPSVSCIDCLKCPEGMEPSVDCGVTVPYGIEVFCVSCKPGLTYSDRFGPHKCKRCTTCSPGKLLISPCSIHRNTVCGTKCLFNQITFFNKSSSVCVDCIKCSVGMEPSISCGALVNAWSRQRCMPCKFGTFSSTYGTEPCKACSMCGDRTVTKKCTRTSNTVCGPCKENYYYDTFVFRCLPCSSCCKSWGNEYPRECNLIKWRNCQAKSCSSTSTASLETITISVLEAHTMDDSIENINSFKNKSKSRSSSGPGSGKLSSYFVLSLSLGCAAVVLLTGVTVVLAKRRWTKNTRIETRSRKLKGK